MKRRKSRRNYRTQWMTVPTDGAGPEAPDECGMSVPFPYLGPIAPDAIIRDTDLAAAVGGPHVAKGARILGYLDPSWCRRRMVIFEGCKVSRFRRALLDHEIDLDLICLAASLGRAPTESEIAIMKAHEATKQSKRCIAARAKRTRAAA